MAVNTQKSTKRAAELSKEPPIFGDAQQGQLKRMYESPPRVAMRKDILRALALREGEWVLELGTGPGLLAQALALAVGHTGKVVGVDINPGLVNMSRERCSDLPWTEFLQGDLTDLRVPDAEFDVVTASSVLQYVADIDTALSEIHRVLRPQGRVLIFETEWDTMVWYSRDRARMKRVLAVWRNVFANPHICQFIMPKLQEAGFQLLHREMIPTFSFELHDDPESMAGIDMIVDMVSGKDGISRAEAEAWAEEQRQLGKQEKFMDCVCRLLCLAQKE